MKLIALLTLSAISILMSACSSYQGHKVASDGSLPPGQRTGIPFQMTRPEYTLTVAPSAADATVASYTLVATYVPDPDNRYTLALDPAIFADSTFLMKFGHFGNLAKSTSGVSSRAVATIGALASVAVDVIGVLRDEATAFGNWRSAVEKNRSKECEALEGKQTKVKEAILAEVSELEQLGNPTPEAGRSQILKYYHPTTTAQRRCLQLVRETIVRADTGNAKVIRQTFDAALKLIEESTEGKRIAELVGNKDLDGLKKYIDELTARIPEPAAKVALGVAQKGRSVLEKDQNKETAEMAIQFADMSAAVWRARHLFYLERKIDEYRTDLLLISSRKREKDINAIELSRLIMEASKDARSLVDSDEMFERLDKLNEFLSDVRMTSDQNNRPPRFNADEYTKIRAERDLLQAQLDLRRIAVLNGNVFELPAVKGKKTITEKKGILIAERNYEFITQVNDGTEKSTDRPNYVLVLESRAKPVVQPKEKK